MKYYCSLSLSRVTYQIEVNGKARTVQRTYKDLQWLHRNLSQRMELGGYIVRVLIDSQISLLSLLTASTDASPSPYSKIHGSENDRIR